MSLFTFALSGDERVSVCRRVVPDVADKCVGGRTYTLSCPVVHVIEFAGFKVNDLN